MRAQMRLPPGPAVAVPRSERPAGPARCCHGWAWLAPRGPWVELCACGVLRGRCDHAHHAGDLWLAGVG